MTKEFKNVTFIMPVLNEEHYLRKAVESVLRQKLSGDFELILALGPSTDGTNKVADELEAAYSEHLKIVHSPIPLTSRSLNLAISQARHEVVVRVDAHSELEPGYAATALEIMNQTGAANVGGMMIAKGNSWFQKAVAFGYNNRIGLGGGAFHLGGKPGPADTVYLGVFQKSVLDELEGFSETWVRGQDWELNSRIRGLGKTVWFDPRLKVSYYPRNTVSELAKQFFKTGVWRGALTRVNPADSSLRYWIPPILLLLSLTWIPLWVYLISIFFYVAFAVRESRRIKLWLLIVLPTMHLSWGAGFWWGLFRGNRTR